MSAQGWGFIECGGRDVFLYKRDLKGVCVEQGQQVQFTMIQNERGPQAQDVTVLVSPDQASYFGEIKSFNPNKGYGFITSEAFPGQDIFVLKTDLPGGQGPAGGLCKFKVVMEAKGAAAKEVMLLGAASKQMAMMRMGMMGNMGAMMSAMMGMMGAKGGKGMGKSNMVWQPMYMKKGMGKGMM
ncbi:unnamed protein product [Effrenium voratum]|nr:unnamed protein product [Effrenium voratum]